MSSGSGNAMYALHSKHALRAGSLLVGLIAALAIVVGPSTALAAACPDTTVRGVRVIELTDELGCDEGASLASRTVRDDGFLQTDVFYCRWGQGGTRPIKRDGKTFYSGFCLNEETEAQASFLARPPLKTCDGGLDDLYDLRARYLDCRTARRVYRRSLKVAAREPARKMTRFRYAGYRWKCRAYNPHKRGDNPAWYEWKCRAKHDVLVDYRWLAGE
jgi:hypothetical protein